MSFCKNSAPSCSSWEATRRSPTYTSTRINPLGVFNLNVLKSILTPHRIHRPLKFKEPWQCWKVRRTGDANYRKGFKDSMSGVLCSDSESSLKLLTNLDVPRKSRHLEIKLEWIKEQVNRGSLVLGFLKRTNNPSDLLTKCLGTSTFEYHRSCLVSKWSRVIVKPDTWSLWKFVVKGSLHLHVKPSVGNPLHGYLSWHGSQEYSDSSVYLNQNRDPKKVFVHVSSPCAWGSPLRHFKGHNEPTSADVDWDQIFPHVRFCLKLGDFSSFELPWRNGIWNRFLTKETLRKAGHLFDVQVHLCATGFRTASGKVVGKSLGFTSNSQPFVMIMNQHFWQCKCLSQHAPMNEVNWSETARYNTTLAGGIVKTAMKALDVAWLFSVVSSDSVNKQFDLFCTSFLQWCIETCLQSCPRQTMQTNVFGFCVFQPQLTKVR